MEMALLRPDYRQQMQGLIDALRAGLSPDIGYDIYSNILAQNAARVQARKERMQSLLDMITQAASQGYTRGTVEDLIDAMTKQPGIPTRTQSAIDLLYPRDLDFSSIPGHQVPTDQQYQEIRAQSVSPLYTERIQQQQQQLLSSPEYQQQLQQQMMQQRWQQFVQDVTNRVQELIAQGNKPEDQGKLHLEMAMKYPDLLSADPLAFGRIIKMVLTQSAFAM
jgi:hypothetical protein